MIKKVKDVLFNDYYFMLLYLIVSLLIPTIFNNSYVNIALKLALVWGMIISAYNIYISFKNKINKIEIVVLMFLGVTLVFNMIFYRNVDNIKCWIVNLIVLMGIFKIQRNKSDEKIKKEIVNLSKIIVIVTTVLSIASLLMYFINKGVAFSSEGTFQGVFNYNNSLAVSSGISLILSFFIFTISKNKIKYVYLINCIMEAVIIVLTEGRSVYLIFLAIPCLFIYIKIRNKIIRRTLLASGVVAAITIFVVYSDKLYNFLSARSELWISAGMVIKNNLFYGVGNADLVSKVMEARKEVVLPGIEFGGLHNIFMQIITANGIIALLLFIVSMVLVFNIVIKKVEESFDLPAFILASLVSGILLINIFESNIMYITSFISIIFWAFLGRIVSINGKLELKNKE